MQSFRRFLDHTEDVFFVARAPFLKELFDHCASAMQEAVVEQETVQKRFKVKILGEDKDPKQLLYDFLDDLVFFKRYRQCVFRNFAIDVEEKDGTYLLRCTAVGENIDLFRHKPKLEFKNLDKAQYKFEKVDDGYKVQVVVKV